MMMIMMIMMRRRRRTRTSRRRRGKDGGCYLEIERKKEITPVVLFIT